MTLEKTAVKGSYWFIFHGEKDIMNSKLRETRSRVVYRLGKVAAQAGTGCCLACPEFWDLLSWARSREDACVTCRRTAVRGQGDGMMEPQTLPASVLDRGPHTVWARMQAGLMPGDPFHRAWLQRTCRPPLTPSPRSPHPQSCRGLMFLQEQASAGLSQGGHASEMEEAGLWRETEMWLICLFNM